MSENNQSENEAFVDSVLDTLRRDLLREVNKIPESWKSRHKYQWITHRYKMLFSHNRLSKKEQKDFENDITVLNL